jgi:hypothetical protein
VSNSWSPTPLLTSDNSARFYARQSARVQLLNSIDPSLAQLPGGLTGVADLNVDSNNLYGQIAAYKGAQTAQLNRDQMESYSPGLQRSLYASSTTLTQQALTAAGYVPPRADSQGSSSLFGSVLEGLGQALGGAVGVIHSVAGPVLDPTLQLAGEIGQVPADMYRAIRTQPDWVQQLALVGAIGATIATGGATAPALFGEAAGGALAAIPSGAAAIGGGFATAGIVNSLQGNWDFWGQAWQQGNAGERVWAPHTLNSARDQIGSDGNLLELAKSMAYDDPLELAKSFGESPDASEQNRLNLVERLATRAGPYGSPEYQSAYASLEKISNDESFKRAVKTLRDGKISFGRDIASVLGFDQGSTPYNMASGMFDAAFVITTDPILAAGGVLKTSRAVRFGVGTTMAADTTAAGHIDWASRIGAILKNPAVRRQSEELATNLTSNEGLVTLYRRRPDLRNMLGTMLSWKSSEHAVSEWTPELVEDFYRSAEASKAFAAGKAMTARHGIIELPHLNPLSEATGRLREQFSRGIDFLDSKNISFKTELGDAGVDDAYHVQAQMGGFTGPFVHFIDGIPFVNHVAESAATLAKSLITKVPHNPYLSLTEEGAHGADWVNQARQFFEEARIAGVPSPVRDQAFANFIQGPNMGARRTILEGYYRTLAEQSGMNTTVEGRDLMETYIDHVKQAYPGGGRTATFTQDAATLIGVPDMLKLRQAIAKQSILNKTLNLADAHWITAGVSGIWKPAVLLRVGFIPRIIGDEMMNFIAKHGITPLVRGGIGKLAVSDPQELARHVAWIDTLTKGLFDGVAKGTMGKINPSIVSEMMHTILLKYSQGIQHLANHGLFGLDNTSGLGKMLAPEGTLRGLAFAGVDENYKRRALELLEKDGPVQAAFLSNVSSKHNHPAADINDVDPSRITQKVDRFGNIEDTVMINPGNSRQFLSDMSPEQHAAQAQNQIDRIRFNHASQIFDEYSISHPGPYVTNALDEAGQSPETLLNELSAHGATMHTEERMIVSHLTAGRNNSIPGLQDYLGHRADWFEEQAAKIEAEARSEEELGKAIAFTKRAQTLRTYSHEIGTASDRSDALRIMGTYPAMTLPPHLQSALGHSPMSDAWMARVLANKTEVLDPLVRHSSYQEARAALTEHMMAHAQTPQWQTYFNGLEDANVTAITKTPVAHLPPEGTVRLWSPHLSQGGRGVMDELVRSAGDLSVDNVTHWLQTKGVTVDEHTVQVITKWAQQEKRITLTSGIGWNEGAATAMIIEDPAVARKASEALARAAKEETSGIAELQVPISGMGRFRINHGIDGVSNPLRYGGVKGYAADPTFVNKDAFQVFGPDYPNVGGIPGATVEQAIQESVQAHIDALYSLHVGPLRNPVEPGPATLGQHVWYNGPKAGQIYEDAITDRTSPVTVNDQGDVIVSPALANADLAAGLPYWRGKAELKELAPMDTSATRVDLPGRKVGMTTDPATVNVHGSWDDAKADEIGRLAGVTTNPEEAFRRYKGTLIGEPSQERIIINVNHRNARQASEWLDALGADYEFTTSGRIPKWAQDKIPGTQSVFDIPVEYGHGLEEIAHATIDENGNRIIRVDDEKLFTAQGQLEERSLLRNSGIDLDKTGKGLPIGWGQHPSFQFMRPEDLYDALAARNKTFDDWVLAHERGHHAMGHVRYKHENETWDEYSGVKLEYERQADRWAANLLGMELPLTDPRSLRLQRAAAKTGIDVDKLHLLMESSGSDVYKQVLGNLESARIAYGDSLQGDMAALKHLQADWDIPVTGNGTLKIPGADISDVPQPLWPVMAPAKIDELHNARGAVASTGDITGIPEELLPKQSVKTVLAARDPKSTFHKLTDWGFDKVGGAIDKLYRQPAFMHYYQQARASTEMLYQSWRDPALFGKEGTFYKLAADDIANDSRMSVSAMSATERSNLQLAGRRMGMNSPTAQQVARVPDAGSWLRGKGLHDLADLVDSAKPLVTVEERMQQLLDKAKSGDLDWVHESQLATVKAAVANDAIHAEAAKQIAIQRATSDMMPFIHDPRVRTQFQQQLNNILPFWFAEDQFMRRWWRALAYDPAVIRKAQLFHMGLKSSGLVQTDQDGNDTFVYPASAAFAEVVSKIPFLHDTVPLVTAMTGQLNATVPGIENFGAPSVTPFLSIPLNQLASVMPELQPAAAAVSGGFDRGVVRALVPGSFMRFYDAISANDSDAKMASAMMTAAAVLEANGQGLPDNADAATQEAYLDRLRNHARTVLLTQAMWGFLVPASPSPRVADATNPLGLDVNFLGAPEQTLRPEYLNLVRNLGVETGTQRFLELYPDTTPDDLVNRNIAYSKGQTARESGAPLPPTVEADNFLNTNRTWMEQYRFAGPWLLPAPTQDDQGQSIDQTAYKDQMNVGFRRQQAPEDFIKNLKFATASGPYFDQIEQFKLMRGASKTVNGRAQVDAVETMFKQQYYATHPIFAEQLQSSDGRARRARILDEMRLAIIDPATPKSTALPKYSDMIRAWDSYQANITQFAGRSGRFVDNSKKVAKNNLLAWMEQYVAQNPEVSSFWAGVLKPEVGA